MDKFMTPKELGIPPKWHHALKLTLAALESGRIKHQPTAALDWAEFLGNQKKDTGLFNMANWQGNYECGTVCCIGGTAELLTGNKISFESDPDHQMTEALTALFYPDNLAKPYELWDYQKITVEQAALALRAYLTYGEPRWRCILGYDKDDF